MRKRCICGILTAILVLFLVNVSAWAVPGLITFQGKFTNAKGDILNGIYIVTFCLFTQETGGSFIWTEQQEITVTNGVYNVQLGAVNTLTGDLFDNESLYLEVQKRNSSRRFSDQVT